MPAQKPPVPVQEVPKAAPQNPLTPAQKMPPAIPPQLIAQTPPPPQTPPTLIKKEVPMMPHMEQKPPASVMNEKPTSVPQQKNHSMAGPIAGTVIITAVLIIGGLYFWGAYLNQKHTTEQLPLIPSTESL